MALYPYDYYDEVDVDPFDPKDELIHDCREHMKDIVSQLFGNSEINKIALDDAICGICRLLDIDVPCSSLTVDRCDKKRLFTEAEAQSLYITKTTI